MQNMAAKVKKGLVNLDLIFVIELESGLDAKVLYYYQRQCHPWRTCAHGCAMWVAKWD